RWTFSIPEQAPESRGSKQPKRRSGSSASVDPCVIRRRSYATPRIRNKTFLSTSWLERQFHYHALGRQHLYLSDLFHSRMAFNRGSQRVGQRWIEDRNLVVELAVVLHLAEKLRTVHFRRRRTLDIGKRELVTIGSPEAVPGRVADGNHSRDDECR